MAERQKTLLLEANGVGNRIIAVDTVLRGVFGLKEGALPPRPLSRFRWANALFGELTDFNARLSYILDWRDAIVASPELDVDLCNINNLVAFGKALRQIRDYDLIIISHSAAGDDMRLLTRAASLLSRRRGKVAMFVGNEYDLLDEKIAFAQKLDVEFICSQLPIATARQLYASCEEADIVEMPHALNPQTYRPLPEVRKETDVGFVGDIYWPFVGDRERTDLIEWFENHGSVHGLVCDIRRSRLDRADWNRFMNGCHAIVGAESGTYYLNDRGALLQRAREYNLFENREASFEEIYDRFYLGQPRELSGKSISSRHFEAVGAKACQILVHGDFNGILQPDLHYISVSKDLENIDDALAKFHDVSFRNSIIENSYEYVMDAHTYDHRIRSLLKVIL